MIGQMAKVEMTRPLLSAPARSDAEALNDIITGTIIICHQPALALCDLDSTFVFTSLCILLPI